MHEIIPLGVQARRTTTSSPFVYLRGGDKATVQMLRAAYEKHFEKIF